MEETPRDYLKRRYYTPISKVGNDKEIKDIAKIFRAFSGIEKIIFYIIGTISFISGVILLLYINNVLSVTIPVSGGSFTEGVIGSPRFINPVLATSDAENDLTRLIYSGLVRVDNDGSYIGDLAESFSISPDGMEYTFIIRDDALWHDGSRVQASDVIFTINRVKDPIIKSPRRASWEGVVVVENNEKSVTFLLQRPFSPFLENTTLGILPSHLWERISVEEFSFSKLNENPIGSGPYKIKKIKLDRNGVPDYYDLQSFSKFTLGRAFIDEIRIKFYPNEAELIKSYENGNVDAVGGLPPAYVKKQEDGGARIEAFPLTRLFALFFNQNAAPVFTNIEVRKALDVGINKEQIVEKVLFGYGETIIGPVPNNILDNTKIKPTSTTTPKNKALEVLTRNGWELDEDNIIKKENKSGDEFMSFSISTENIDELIEVANLLKEAWEKFGASVTIKIFEQGDLKQNVIRPREYEALLFGEVIGRDPDPFAFWHSSQRLDPGLNIALYANITADSVIEEARTILDFGKRVEKYRTLQDEIDNDIPAIFLYSPDFLYLIDEKIDGLAYRFPITTPSERFINVYKWHIFTSKVWKIFN